MTYLILSILSATGLYVVFKLFANFGVRNFQAIVVNYIVASSFGFWYAAAQGTPVSVSGSESWLWIPVVVGISFIILFQIMALTSQIHGVSVTSIATKMSMVIPTFFFILFDPAEGFTVMKILGIILGILAVVLASIKKKDTKRANRAWLIPLVLFLGTGFMDLLLAFAEKNHLQTAVAYRNFVPLPFAVSAIAGLIVLGVQFLRKRASLHLRSIIAGIVLGFVNYGSIYFFLRILGSGLLDRSSAIPANNIGTVALSAILGIVFFRERLSAKNILGIVLALTAILLLTWKGL